MDPNATVQLMNNADTFAEAKEAAEDLRDWLNRGGFQPDWTQLNAQAWKALQAVDFKRWIAVSLKRDVSTLA